MRDSLFHIDRSSGLTLQMLLREKLVSAILAGHLPPSSRLPSSRLMAKRLKVSLNTVLLAYQALTEDGYIVARDRSGHYVAPDIMHRLPPESGIGPAQAAQPGNSPVDWAAKLALHPAEQSNIVKPKNWYDYPYPFIYGQVDANLFPVSVWRDCTRQAMNRKWLYAWTEDRYTEDDPMLVEQIRQRVLTRRGILAKPDEVLVTLGSQNSLYLLASLLVRPGTVVAMEDPGYADIRNMFSLLSADVRTVALDTEGLRVDQLGAAQLAFVTPSHQFPTNVTMSLDRRRALLDWASSSDALVIEDDYEFETNYYGSPIPALKSLDTADRVLYTSSLSKSLMPGLRIGFMVGPRELIKQARALRRLILRHPPSNNQRVAALFLSLGHHDALIAKLHHAYTQRWQTLAAALDAYLPGWAQAPTFGGTSFWVKAPPSIDARLLAARAIERGVVIETGDVYFADPEQGRNYFRLSFSSIPEDRIWSGIANLAAAVAQLKHETSGT
jgi:GntR family transcriptional regulator/MocR family aminotransferase